MRSPNPADPPAQPTDILPFYGKRSLDRLLPNLTRPFRSRARHSCCSNCKLTTLASGASTHFAIAQDGELANVLYLLAKMYLVVLYIS